MEPIRPELREAFVLFVTEFESHLSHFEKVLEQVNGGALPSESERGQEQRALEHRFHILRGSAGFFKLTELKDRASEAEKFLHRNPPEAEYSEYLRGRFPELVNFLRDHLRGLKESA